MSDQLFEELLRLILLKDVTEKCQATAELADNLKKFSTTHTNLPIAIPVPGLPEQLTLVAPRKLKRRGIQSQVGRNILMHSIAHIEFNAINLALDAAYRFRDQAQQYYQDWIGVAADEARHFGMIRDYLQSHDCDYGDYPAHNGLWEMAVKTADDIVARMALVPRVLEARGLDVTPAIINRLASVGDQQAIDILEVIYQDEIGHVAIGSHWFFHHCEQRGLEPRTTFSEMVDVHLHGDIRGPLNIAARLQAGFDEIELAQLEQRSS